MKLTALFITTLLCALSASAADAPEAQIANKQLQVKMYLPDAANGFYKGVRFDPSGIINSVQYKGHTFYGPWFTKSDPAVRDFAYQGDDIAVGLASGAMGPAEEFQTPLGYDTAKNGDTFVKIGVGVLKKRDDTRYAFSNPYDNVNPGKWPVNKKANSISFTQELTDAASGYAYVYTKTIHFNDDTNEMVIDHSLKNTGKLPIKTLLYDHNFTMFDHLPTGEITVTTPYTIASAPAGGRGGAPAGAPGAAPQGAPPQAAAANGAPGGRGGAAGASGGRGGGGGRGGLDPNVAAIDGKTFAYKKTLEGQERVSSPLAGFGSTPADYDFRIENHKAGIGVRIQGDQPLQNASLWSIRSVVAVEPFINIAADPGNTFTWKYTYTFYTLQ